MLPDEKIREVIQKYFDLWGSEALAVNEAIDGAVRETLSLAEKERGESEILLRKEVWLGHCGAEHISILYGDDGEMQCSVCGIDFKRQSVKEIIERIEVMNLERLKTRFRSRSPEGGKQ